MTIRNNISLTILIILFIYLTLNIMNRKTVIGVVSHGQRGCPTSGYAQMFAKITGFLDWINANVAVSIFLT